MPHSINGFSGYYYRTADSYYGKVGSEDVAGNSGSRSITYGYDDDEYLTTAGGLTLTYDDPDGKLTGTALTSITDTYGHNSFGEVTSYAATRSATDFYEYTLTRDGLGRVSQKVEVLNGVTSTFDYTYDSAGRLTQVNKNTVTVRTYSYDDNSNRTGGTINGTSTTATYDDQDRMTAYNVNDYTYNRNGELQTKVNTLLSQTTSYVYDLFGNLTEVTLPNTDVITYEIDPLNRRFGRKLNGTLQKRFMYDTDNRLIAEFDSSNVLKRRYVYASKKHVPDYFIDDNGDEFRIVTDYLGSVRIVMKESTGAVVQRMEHDEFGRVVLDTSPGYQPFGFAGGIYDHQTGLVRFGARDFDPETGRWTSKDPIRFDGEDTNLFGYVMNDPVNLVDPSGYSPTIVLPIVVIGRIAIGAIGACSMDALMSPPKIDPAICQKAFDAAIAGCARGPAKDMAICFKRANDNLERCKNPK